MIICPHLILRKNNKVLLLKRAPGARILSGLWHCPTGKMEGSETPQETIIRETREEIGIDIQDPLFSTAVYIDIVSWESASERWQDISLFFVKDLEDSEPVNVEPLKHVDMGWFDLENLPQPMVRVVEQGLFQSFRGIPYGEMRDPLGEL